MHKKYKLKYTAKNHNILLYFSSDKYIYKLADVFLFE